MSGTFTRFELPLAIAYSWRRKRPLGTLRIFKNWRYSHLARINFSKKLTADLICIPSPSEFLIPGSWKSRRHIYESETIFSERLILSEEMSIDKKIRIPTLRLTHLVFLFIAVFRWRPIVMELTSVKSATLISSIITTPEFMDTILLSDKKWKKSSIVDQS